ncbi:MAG: TetR/AcrR family transcriptional regulator [Lewinellaceae bacterium]|nr:TetR/AcrR family transcriptional regulator [Lewinellaceae bacterium]
MARPKAFDQAQVLDRAVELFWRKGYHATSIQDVVENLGINRASLYDTFGDKHTLYIKSLERYRTDQSQAMIRFLQGPGKPLDKIRILLATTAKATLQDQDLKGCFLVNATMELINTDQDVAAIVASNQSEMEHALEKTVQEGQDLGDIDDALDPRAVAAYLFSQLNCLRMMGKMQAAENVLANVISISLKTLL